MGKDENIHAYGALLRALLRSCLFALFAFLLFSCRPSEETAHTPPDEPILTGAKQVLYISSYSPALFTFDEQRDGILRRFEHQPVTLDVECLDTKNFPTPENLDNFKRSLLYKLERGKRYDAVIVGDDNGLVFLMEHKDELFPDTPVFFLGINNLETAVRSQEDPLVTGVVEAKSIYETIQLAFRINPGARRVVCLIDNTTSSQAEYAEILGFTEDFPQLEFAHINMADGTFEEFYKKVAALGRDDIMPWLSAVTDRDGNAKTYDEMRHILLGIVNTPIYGFASYGIGDGMFGGCVISHEDQGFAAADMVMEYFLGTPVHEIPFSTESPNTNMVDYQLYKKFDFPLENLPEDTILVNRTYTFWELHGRTVALAVLVIMTELLIIFLLITNIMRRRKTESALRRNEKKFRSYIENAPDGIFIINGKGDLFDVNDSFCRFTGYTRSELLRLSMDRLMENIEDFMKEGLGRDELAYLTKTGEKRYWSVDAVKLEEERYLCFAKDVTERREAREKKEKLEQQLHQSRKMDAVGQLAGGIAHDFNNILGGIMGVTQILRSPKRNPDKETREFLDMIMSSSERAADLNAKLLAFSRKGKVSSTVIDIDDILKDTLAILEQTIDRKIEITLEQEAANTRVVGDDSALQNSLLNLCINASHAMPRGGDLTITTRNLVLDENYCAHSSFDIEPGEFIDIEVRDTGTGIAPENLEKIFEPFFTTKEEGKGTGLGLAALYGTVRDHKGTVSVYSEVNLGTVFHLMLPCTESVKIAEETAEATAPGSGLILLVDDEEFIRVTGKFTLEEMGYSVILADNGVEAVDIYREKHNDIDLVLMDMIMPRMNGGEAFKLMKEIDPQCKVVISSGFTRDENLRELKRLGLLGFIQKPYRNNELLRLISDVLGE